MTLSYPICLNLSRKLCVVIGGGAVGERKVLGLLEAGAQVRVVSPEISPRLTELAHSSEIEAILSPYRSSYIEGATLVFAATSLRQVNEQAIQDSLALNILSNSADSPESGDFTTPSVVRRGELCVSVSTGGNSPSLSARISGKIAEEFGEEFGEYIQLLGRFRAQAKVKIVDARARKTALVALLNLEAELLKLLRTGEIEKADELAQSTLDRF